MAINKKLIHFKLKSTFLSELEAGNILDTSIVFIQDAKEIWTHGTYYSVDTPEIFISEGTQPQDGEELWVDLNDVSDFIPIEDAPSDGKVYGRQDGEWVEAGSIGLVTETIKVTLRSNLALPDPSLYGTVITITYSDLLKQEIWNGLEITFNIAGGLECTLTSTQVEGYSTPSSQTFTTVMGESRNIILDYNTTILSVTRASNQPEDLGESTALITSTSGINKTLNFSDASTTQEVKIPLGDTYNITPSQILDYATPLAISKLASLASELATLTYNTEVVTIQVTSDDSSSVVGQTITVNIGENSLEYLWLGDDIIIKVPYGQTCTISVSNKSGYSTPEKQTFVANQVSTSVVLLYKYAPIIGTLFVDSDGANQLTQDSELDKSWIKGKRCLVKKTSDGVAICYLDDNNSELFHDGVTSASLDGSMGQWMTDIPEYWFNVDETTSGTHILNISLSELSNYKQSRRVLVGVTEAVNESGKLWSKKGGTSTGSLTSTVFHNYAIALGDGFDTIDYETHCKIAHLFYTKYANRDPQTMSQFGYGENSYTRTIGTTSSLGNNDGKTSTQISFLGIEDFYGGKYEWMSGIHSNGSIYYIYDGYEPDKVPTTSYRTVDIGGSSRSGYISKVEWGEYADMIPTEVTASSTTHYCDYGSVAISGWRVAMRSFNSASDSGGVACFFASSDSGYSSSAFGSRIQYRGNILIIDSPAEFIALPVGF